MLPRVIVYNAVSLDGMTTGFEPDLGQFYAKASSWPEDVTLAGSDTILAAPEGRAVEHETVVAPSEKPGKSGHALLVVLDSRGRVRCWNFLRKAGYWRGVAALCSRATPRTYLDYLERRGIDRLIAGKRKVDLKAALGLLSRRYGVKTVRVESGGVLNGLLMRAGLVSEVSLLVHPVVVGPGLAHPFCHPPRALRRPLRFKPVACERVKRGLVWLRYKVVRG